MDKFIIATISNIDWHYDWDFLPIELRFKFTSPNDTEKIYQIVKTYIKQFTNQIAHSYDIECHIYENESSFNYDDKTICIRYGKITVICD